MKNGKMEKLAKAIKGGVQLNRGDIVGFVRNSYQLAQQIEKERKSSQKIQEKSDDQT